MVFQHPQHPWQSWRDRWIKQFMGGSRPYPLPHNAPPTPPSDVPTTIEPPRARQPVPDIGEDGFKTFTEDDAELLLRLGDQIPPKNSDAFWTAWALAYDVRVTISITHSIARLTLNQLD